MPISACAGIDLERKVSRNSARFPGFVRWVLISMIMDKL